MKTWSCFEDFFIKKKKIRKITNQYFYHQNDKHLNYNLTISNPYTPLFIRLSRISRQLVCDEYIFEALMPLRMKNNPMEQFK